MTELPASAVPPPAGSWRERYPMGPWTAAAAAVCGCAVVALVDPTEHMVTPPCPLRALTGWWCPFCGATRAASRLLRGDLPTALHFNALFVLFLPLAGLLWAAWAFPGRLHWLDPIRERSKPMVTFMAVAFGLFMVVRNTPLGDAWLRYPGA